jgi:hypothetical protein
VKYGRAFLALKPVFKCQYYLVFDAILRIAGIMDNCGYTRVGVALPDAAAPETATMAVPSWTRAQATRTRTI